jgi:predicted NBD/HSP70 family sugar kinase
MISGGTNLPRVRDYNQGVVLEIIRTGDGASRVEIAEKTGLTAQTVSNIVKRLQDEELVIEAGVAASGSGKPRVLLQINPNARYAVGVLLDRDMITLVLMGLDGRIVARNKVALNHADGLAGVIEQVVQTVEGLIRNAKIEPGRVVGVGLGCPGPMDHEKGIVYEPFDLLGWGHVPLKELLQKRLPYRIVIDNDATAAAIGERWVRGTHGAQNFAFIFMGVGIGAGLVIQNQIYRGATTNAGEFGHMTLNPEGPTCFCGNRGCIEMYCSPAKMVEAAKNRLAEGENSLLQPDNLTIGKIYESATNGDKLANDVVEKAARMLGYGVVNLANLLDLEMVVLGGKFSPAAGTLFQRTVQALVQEKLVARNVYHFRVELSAAGEAAGAVGAAAVVLHEIFAPRPMSLGLAI